MWCWKSLASVHIYIGYVIRLVFLNLCEYSKLPRRVSPLKLTRKQNNILQNSEYRLTLVVVEVAVKVEEVEWLRSYIIKPSKEVWKICYVMRSRVFQFVPGRERQDKKHTNTKQKENIKKSDKWQTDVF